MKETSITEGMLVSEFGLTKVKCPQYKGYNEYLDDAGNKVYWDIKAKKVVPCITVDMPVGGKASSPKQVEAQDQYVARCRTREYNKILNFYFVTSKDRKQEAIKPQTLARVFFLATYLRENDNHLYAPDGKPLKKADLAKLMRLSSSAFKDFWKDAENKYLFQQNDKSIMISEEFFQGALADHKSVIGGGNGYQQVFIKSLRQLYWQTSARKHCYLGYLFMILHQINWEYNILCWNPWEKDRDKVETMSLDDFCCNTGAEGHTENQRQRLLEAYKKLQFNVGNTRQYLVAYLEDHISEKFFLVVNPNLLYRGHDRSKVEGFGTFFPDISTRTV